MKGVKGAESLTEPLEHASNKTFSVSLNLPHGMSAYMSLQAQAASSTSLLLRKHSLVQLCNYLNHLALLCSRVRV